MTVLDVILFNDMQKKMLHFTTPRPIAEYHEDMGTVLWWCWEEAGNKLPGRWMGEPPYVGSPNDCGYTVQIDTIISTHDGKQPSSTRNFDVGGWPGYHTHFTPIVMPDAPKE
jgi:hypothetical protein